jgi:HAD superfamily hydrolase (TIGR01509 family)
MLNNLVIFDLDGVLIESRDLHYHSLNSALEKVGSQYTITREEHLSTYDGLNTTRKLELLSQDKGLDKKFFNKIWEDKQTATFNLIKKIKRDDNIIKMFQQIKDKEWKIAVASNSIRETVKLSLLSLGVLEYVDFYISNEDVKRTKPYPEMYWSCMTTLNAIPKTTIIIEDSHIGREGALNSGAHLLPIENAFDLKDYKVFNKMKEVENGSHKNHVPWRDEKLNVLIPMAGAGTRFAQAGYTFPKPLIEIHNKPMIQVVTDNLNIEANYIFLVQKEHYEKYNLQSVLNVLKPGCTIVQVDGLTEGAACTTLLAKEFINNDSPLVMANSDQFVEWDSNNVMYSFSADGIDGGILTFKATHPKWSYAKLDDNGFVTEVAEKKPISDNATVGIYYWKKGSDYVKYAEQMIEKNIRTNNEFYVCPVFNEAISDCKKIRIKKIEKMWGLGTPEDLNYFLENYDEQ